MRQFLFVVAVGVFSIPFNAFAQFAPPDPCGGKCRSKQCVVQCAFGNCSAYCAKRVGPEVASSQGSNLTLQIEVASVV
jgi:hypothetical protein